MKMDIEEYLGDGLYASFDGWQFKLRAPRESTDHEVYLEPIVYQAFVRFATKCYEQARASDAAAYRIAEDNER